MVFFHPGSSHQRSIQVEYAHNFCGNEKYSQQSALQAILRMIIIPVFFGGGSTVEEHDIAHIASSIFSPLDAGFFSLCPHT
ncbi:hypothetical protein FQ626_11775 [Erwinia pyrifoliae]|nr:hypothetical protein [Erwinia pyrifoliae]